MNSRWIAITAIAGGLLGLATVPAQGAAPSKIPLDPSSELQKLTPKPLAKRVPVAIYQFRSEVQEVSGSAATDMFVTALVKSSQFRVVERARLNEGVVQEKKMNASGMTTGAAAQSQLRGAEYLFEGAVTEANAGESARQGGFNIGGLSLGGSRSQDSIAIDVRILDGNSGDILDAINVSVPVKSSSRGISGTAALADTVASLSGRVASPLTPDVSMQSSKRDGVDKTVRLAIEAAVLELVKRIDLPAAAN